MDERRGGTGRKDRRKQRGGRKRVAEIQTRNLRISVSAVMTISAKQLIKLRKYNDVICVETHM